MLALLELASRWAPLVLIALGALRIVEWLLDRRRLREARDSGVPARPSRLSSGLGFVLVLFVLLSLFGRLPLRHLRDQSSRNFFSPQRQNWDELFGQRHESTSTFTQACPPGTTLAISLGHGDLTITGDSNDGKIHTTVHTTVFSATDKTASSKADALTPTFHAEGSQLTLSVPYAEEGRVDLTLSIPTATPVSAHSDHGDMAISTLTAAVSLIADHGDVQLSAVQGPVQVKLNNSNSDLTAHQIDGPVSASGKAQDITLSDVSGPLQIDGEIFGDMHLERVRGPIRLHTSRINFQVAALPGSFETEEGGDVSGDQLTGPVTLNARNRNISLDHVLGPLSISNQNGSVTASALSPLAPIDISNRSGEVTLNLPDTASFTINADTTDADLTNSFGLLSHQDNDKVELQARVGNGVPLIRLHSTQADIHIDKSSGTSGDPQVPSPPRAAYPPQPQHKESPRRSSGGEVDF